MFAIALWQGLRSTLRRDGCILVRAKGGQRRRYVKRLQFPTDKGGVFFKRDTSWPMVFLGLYIFLF